MNKPSSRYLLIGLLLGCALLLTLALFHPLGFKGEAGPGRGDGVEKMREGASPNRVEHDPQTDEAKGRAGNSGEIGAASLDSPGWGGFPEGDGWEPAKAVEGLRSVHYLKREKRLPVLVNRIAVMRRGLSPEDPMMTERLASKGFRSGDLVRHPIAGWILASTENVGSADPAGSVSDGGKGIELLADSLAREDGNVDFVSPVFVDPDAGGLLVVTPTLLVGFADDVAIEKRREILASIPAIPESLNSLGLDLSSGYLKIPLEGVREAFTVLAAANALAVRDEVLFAEPDMIFEGKGSLIPNDPEFPASWGLRNTGQSGGLSDFDMDADEAWDRTTGSASIKVLIIDSGVQQDHPDINQLPGSDFTSESGSNPFGNPVNSFDNHGTPVAGAVSAIINNATGAVGVAPGVKSVAARCFISTTGGSWTANYSWTADALYWAAADGVRVSNNSNGYGGTSAAVATAYQTTRTGGMVHFASAGNGGTSSLGYPANLATVNGIAASNRDGERTSFSQWGTGLAFTAPGEEIRLPDRTGSAGYSSGDVATLNGTSFSSPYSAGVAALVLSLNPALDASGVEAILQQTCVDMGTAGYDTDYGWGHINAGAATAAVAVLTPQTITFNPIPDKLTTNTVVLSATGGGSGNPVTFAVTAGPGSISGGNILTFTGAGTVTVTASQAGNASYSPAPNVSRNIIVTKANAGLTLTSLSQTYNGTVRQATATTNPGGLAVSFTYDGLPAPPVNAGSYAVVGTINDNIYQGSASGTLVVGKATASLTLTNLSQVYNGTPRSVGAGTTPSGLSTTATYNGSTFAPTNVGTYAVVVTINDTNYQGSTSGTFNITKAAATITLTNLSQTYSGGPRPVSVTTNPLGLSYTLTYNGIASAPFDAGTYNVAAAINHANYQGSNTAVLEVSKAAQIIDFPEPPATTPATSIVILTANGGGSGSPVVYSIVSGPGELQSNRLTFTGSGLVRVAANQAGGPNHDPAALVEREFNVVKVTAGVTLSSMSQVYDGSAKQPVATTTPTGLPVAFTFNGSGASPSNVGTYALAATVSDPRYAGGATGTFEIQKAPAEVTLSSLSQVYDGNPRDVAAVTNPAGLNVQISYAGSPIPPTHAGTYAVVATIVEGNYAGSGTGELVVAKAQQTIGFAPIAEQEATATLLLSATGGGSGNPVFFTVTEGPANLNGNTLTFFGTGDVSVRADQAGDANHDPAPPVFRSFSVTRERVEMTISGLTQPYDGTPRPVSVTTNPAGLPVRVTYGGSLDPPSLPGTYFVLALVDEEFYEGDAGGFLEITKGVQAIDFPQPVPVLADATVTLPATGGASGNPVNFEVISGPGEVSGDQLTFTGDGFVTVRATQAGNELYDAATPVDRIVSVSKATATVTLSDLTHVYDGSAKTPTATTTPAGLAVSHQFNGGPDPAVHAGTYAVATTISDPRYAGSTTGTFEINKATQVIDFSQPAPALTTDSVVLQANGGGSGNAVVFSIQSGPGSVNGNVLTFSGAGTVVVLANQAGDGDHEAAPEVSRSIGVSKAPPASLTLTRTHQVFDGTARIVVAVTDPPGLDVDLSYEGDSEAPTGTGIYTIVGTIDDPIYEGTVNGILTVDDPYRLEIVPGGTLPSISSLGAPGVSSFALSPYEVTWSVWSTVRDWANGHGYDFGPLGEACAPDHPVRGVNWLDAVKWCNARTEWENEILSRQIEPAYRVAGAVFRSGTPSTADEVICDPGTSGYRLPSGSEREFAARGGEATAATLYPGSHDPAAAAWHAANSAGVPCDLSGGRGTHPAGGLLPNELGIYDLAGNVAEWTGDAAPGDALSRMANGGDWDASAAALLLSSVQAAPPATRDSRTGFRVARSLSEAIAAGVDRTDLTWETGGEQTWFAASGMPGSANVGAGSPAPGEGEEHWVEVEASGPGNLSFLWSLSTPAGAAGLTVEIDGIPAATAPENVGLASESIYLSSGSHWVRWRHRGLLPTATQPGVHGAWLDAVVLTPAVIPDLTTVPVTELEDESAMVNAALNDDGGSPVTAVGFMLGLPGGGETEIGGDPGELPDFEELADSLSPGTTYRVRAYAINEVGTGYGDWIRFTTSETLSIEENAAIRDREIESGDGHVFDFTLLSPRHLVVNSTGGAPVTAVVLDWEGNVVAETTGTGDFTINELLLPGTYRLRIERGSDGGPASAYQVTLDGTTLAESLPDVAVGPSTGAQTGRGLRTGRTGQNVIVFSPKARPVQGFATIANLGTLPDEMRIYGSRGNADFALSYFGIGGNLTGGMLTGRAAGSELVAGGDIEVIRIAVTPNKKRIVKKVKKRTVTLKKTLLVSIRAVSTFDPAETDGASIQVKTR